MEKMVNEKKNLIKQFKPCSAIKKKKFYAENEID